MNDEEADISPQEFQGLKYVKPNYIHRQEGVAVSSSRSKSKLSARNDYQGLTSLSAAQNFGMDDMKFGINRKQDLVKNLNVGNIAIGKRGPVSNRRSSSRGTGRKGGNLLTTESAPQNNGSDYIVTAKGPIEGLV